MDPSWSIDYRVLAYCYSAYICIYIYIYIYMYIYIYIYTHIYINAHLDTRVRRTPPPIQHRYLTTGTPNQFNC